MFPPKSSHYTLSSRCPIAFAVELCESEGVTGPCLPFEELLWGNNKLFHTQISLRYFGCSVICKFELLLAGKEPALQEEREGDALHLLTESS